MVTLWGILSTIAPILAPILSLLLVTIGRIIWNHEKRIRQLERETTRHGRSLYGDDEDAQQTGVSQDMKKITDRIDDIQSDIVDIKQQITDE